MSFSPSASIKEKKSQVGAFLRNADKLIKEGKLDEAEAEIAKVFGLEPQNAYAMAFGERIQTVKNLASKPKEIPAVPPTAPHSTPKTDSPEAIKSDVSENSQATTEADAAVSASDPQNNSSQTTIPVENTITDELPPEKPKTPPSETARRTDIEQKLEEDYKIKFAAEIQKAEQRVADRLKSEEEKHAAERASLLEQLAKERSKFREQMEQSFSERLQAELQKSQEQQREQFELEKQRIEQDVRSRIESEYEAKAREFEKSIAHERNSLAAKEQQSISMMKAELEADFASRLLSELDKIKQSSHIKEEKSRLDMESAVRAQIQKDYETRLADERGLIETRYQKLEEQLEASFKTQQQNAIEESRQVLELKLAEATKSEEDKFAQQRLTLQQKMEREYEAKIQAFISEERRKQEADAQEALTKARTEFERERDRLMEQEQNDLEELRTEMREAMNREMTEQLDRSSKEMIRAYEHRMVLLGVEIPKTKEQKLKVYQTRVREAWESGPLTMEKAQQLMEIQEILELEFDDHSICEAEVRLQLYAENVQQAILSGRLKPSDSAALEEMKARYDITPDEAANVEPIILSAFQRSAVKAIIMVVDDDKALLDIITERLQELSYSVIPFNTLAEAMTAIENTSVDLILSDIQFKGEKGDGFTFFKFVQQKPHLRKIPFILMSSLDEGLFIRTGVQLGVDDYLTKPLDIDLLTAVIEGKLKKYRIMNS